MPRYEITSPDGQRFEITAPEGASQEEALSYAQRSFSAPQRRAADEPAYSPTGGSSFLENAAAGAGKFVADSARAAKQIWPVSDRTQNEAAITESRKLDAPLMKTGGGIAGNIAPALATALIPGVNTLTGAAAVGAGLGALQPTVEGESRLTNAAVSAGLGAAGQKAGQVVTGAVTRNLGERAATRASAQNANAVRDATLKEVADAGYVLPPSAVGDASFITNRLESVAGKAALNQAASAKNQQTTNLLARRALGLADDAPLSEGAIEQVRRAAGAAYQDIADLSPRAASALDKLKEARFDSKAYWRHYNVSADPKSLSAARTFDQKVDMLERVIEKEATAAGRPELVPALKEARALIAKTYDVDKALNIATGDVSAKVLGAALDKGRPLTGELATAGRFAEGFGAFAKEGAKTPAAGVSKAEALTSVLLGTIGGSTMGPGGAALAAMPLVSPVIRSALLKPRGAPSYSTPIAERAAQLAVGDNRLTAAIRALLPAGYLQVRN